MKRENGGNARMGEADIDLELVKRVQRGDKVAFDLLVRKYQQRIIQAVTQFTKNRDDAMDVAQEAFIKAYRALPNFRGESAFYTWLYRIAINTAKNHLTAQKSRPPRSDVDADEAGAIGYDPKMRDTDSPDELLHRDQLKELIVKTIEGMQEDLRTAITLREIEGMSYEEIATTVDIPVGTVRSRIFRAREVIENAIRPMMQGELA